MLQCRHPIFPSDLCLHIVELTFLDEWRCSIMANGELYVTATSVLLMQMLFVEWQVFLELSVLSIMLHLVEDIIVRYLPLKTYTLTMLFLIEPIWLYNIGCSTGDEVLEDCSRLNWGSYSSSCSYYHYDDVGVICRPSEILL